MNQDIEAHSDEGLDAVVYGCLLALTAATLAASLFVKGGRIMAVAIALIIASMKGSLIAFYYMGLRRERPFVFLVLGVGFVAVLILIAGILPDMTFARF